MTRPEALKILALLKASYPRPEVGAETVSVYADAIMPLEAEQVLRAARQHIATQRYWPSISELLLPVAEEQVGAAPAEQAWEEVTRAISRRGRYRPWDLSPLAARAVDAIGKDEICNAQELGVIRAHFMRIYESYRGTELASARVAPLSGCTYQPSLPGERRGAVTSGEAVARLLPARRTT